MTPWHKRVVVVAALAWAAFFATLLYWSTVEASYVAM